MMSQEWSELKRICRLGGESKPSDRLEVRGSVVEHMFRYCFAQPRSWAVRRTGSIWSGTQGLERAKTSRTTRLAGAGHYNLGAVT